MEIFPRSSRRASSDQIEEERRLLYVAMTRAKNDLHLIAPLKYYVTNQSKTRRPPRIRREEPVPDRSGHGNARRHHVAREADESGAERARRASARVNVAGKLRSMW